MMDQKQKFIALLVIYFAAISFIFALVIKLIESYLPSDGLVYVVTQTLLNAIVLICGLYLITRHYDEEYFDGLKNKFEEIISSGENIVNDLLRAKNADKFLISDTKLFDDYESKVESNNAIIVVTPTFRNDYWGQHNRSTSGEKFANGVFENLSKRGIIYRYISTREAVAQHVPHLVAYHREALKKNPNAIKIYSTAVPIIAEMVHYPLVDNSAFTILYTDSIPGLKVTEFNVKMLQSEDLDRLRKFIRFILNQTSTQIWEIGDGGTYVKPREINDDDRNEFTTVTGVSVLPE